MNLQVFGVYLVMELAPIILAVERMGGQVRNGGAAHLIGMGHLLRAQAGVPGVVDGEDPVPYGEGGADIATNAETQLLRLSPERPDMRVIMTGAESIYRIVARRSAGIAGIGDLKGKRVSTFPRTSAAFYLFDELRREGLSEADVVMIPAAPGHEVARQLIEGHADAIAIWEPAAQTALDALGSDGIAFRSPDAYRMLFGVNTTKAVLDDPGKRAEVVELLRQIIKATHDVNADPSIAWPIAARTSGYPIEQIQACWPHHRWTANLAPDLLDIMVDQEAWIAAEQGRVPRRREDLASLIDDGPYREALAPTR